MEIEQFVREFLPLVLCPGSQLNVVESQLKSLTLEDRIGDGAHPAQQMVEVVSRQTSLGGGRLEGGRWAQ